MNRTKWTETRRETVTVNTGSRPEVPSHTYHPWERSLADLGSRLWRQEGDSLRSARGGPRTARLYLGATEHVMISLSLGGGQEGGGITPTAYGRDRREA